MTGLRQLKKLNNVNGDTTAGNRIVKDVEAPEENRDATNKKWVTDNFVAI